MKSCVVCNKAMKQKDSVMVTMCICSELCKTERKKQLPKKISITSAIYWINQGYSEIDAKQKVSELQASRSPRTLVYWMNKGFTEEVAMQKISEFQKKHSDVRLAKYTHEERQLKTPMSPKYWLNKGYSEDKTSKILSERADGSSLAFHIKKYGEQKGKELYEQCCTNRKITNSIDHYITKHGQVVGKLLWEKKYKNRHNSKKATDFFSQLLDKLSDYKVYTAGNDNGEYGVLDKSTNTYYFYDFVIPELKICVEFHGDYWHCNPKKYNEDYFHKQANSFARDLWKKDENKQKCLLTERDIHTIIVWESDNHQEMLTLILEKIYESAKSQN